MSTGTAQGSILVLGAVGLWPAELLSWIRDAGYRIVELLDVSVALSHVLIDDVRAVLIRSHQFSIRETVVLSLCRRASPGTAVVEFERRAARRPSADAIGACTTACLTWPSTPALVLAALGSNGARKPGRAASGRSRAKRSGPRRPRPRQAHE